MQFPQFKINYLKSVFHFIKCFFIPIVSKYGNFLNLLFYILVGTYH